MTTKWVYRFNEVDAAEEAVGGSWDKVRGLLGGKGANLGEMSRLGVPVPPGFTITTEACNQYIAEGGKLPEGLLDQVADALKVIEERTGKMFGDAQKPLLVSCRSGAKFSMPGMMDTVLNIGLNAEVVKGLAAQSGDEHFAYDSYRRLVQMFGSVVLGHRDELFEQVLSEFRRNRNVASDSDLTVDDLREIVERFRRIASGFPDDPKEQLRLAVEAVFRSWNGRRAIDYRNAAGIAHDLGTAVNIQVMVFGNLGSDSATGVAMTPRWGDGCRRDRGRLPHQRPRRRCRGRHSRDERSDGAEGRNAAGLQRARRHRREARAALSRDAGHGVHGGAGQAVAAPDP